MRIIRFIIIVLSATVMYASASATYSPNTFFPMQSFLKKMTDGKIYVYLKGGGLCAFPKSRTPRRGAGGTRMKTSPVKTKPPVKYRGL